MFALATEAFFEVLSGDEASVVDVKVMECEQHIVLCDGLAPVNCDGQELGVINLTVVVEVYSLENLINFGLGHIELVKSLTNLCNFQRARVVSVESAERIAKLRKVK